MLFKEMEVKQVDGRPIAAFLRRDRHAPTIEGTPATNLLVLRALKRFSSIDRSRVVKKLNCSYRDIARPGTEAWAAKSSLYDGVAEPA